ncbi:LuxR C-terminal-related transcriptional regulator [Actinomadura sp. 9N215]
MEPADYRRICRVLDDVLGAHDHTQFRERLRVSLARNFGWEGAVSVPQTCADRVLGDGRSLAIVPPTRAGARAHARHRAILDHLDRYLNPLVGDFGTADGHEAAGGNGLSLTHREREVAELVAAGLTNDQIAERMHITVGTVKKHLSQAMAKNDCTSRTQLALLLRRPSAPGAG